MPKRTSFKEHNKRHYKPPSKIEVLNSKLDPDVVARAKRINKQIESKRDKEPWDALEGL